MKKILLIGTAALGMFFMTTSCLENTEPAGIEAMRQAKAELISAEAAYQAALTAYQQAQIALVEAKVQAKNLDNQLKELDLQEKQLELELQEAQNQHQIRMWELEYLLEQETNEAEIKRLEAEIALYEWQIMSRQMDVEQLERDREAAIEKHEAYMLQLQAATAQAQYNYEKALRDIEAMKNGLSTEEQNLIDEYIAKIDALRPQLQQAEQDLLLAQQNVISMKYDYVNDSTLLHMQYEREVALAQENLDNANAYLTEIQEADFTDQEYLLTEAETITGRLAEIEEEINSLEWLAADKRLALEEPQAKLDSLNQVIMDIQQEMNTLNGQTMPGLKKPQNLLDTITLTIPASIADFAAAIFQGDIWNYFCNTYGNGFATQPLAQQKVPHGYVYFIDDFEYNETTFKYELGQDGILSWEANNYTSSIILQLFKTGLEAFVLSSPEQADLQTYLTSQEAYLESLQTTYEDYVEQLPLTVAEWDKSVSEYPAVYEAAIDAIALWREKVLPSTAEAAKDTVTKVLDALRAEQEYRATLVNKAYTGWENLTYANLTDPQSQNPIDDWFIESVISEVENGMVELYDFNGNPDYINAVAPSPTEPAVKSIAQEWNELSQALYGNDFQYYRGEELTLDLIGYGEYFTAGYSVNKNNQAGAGYVYVNFYDLKSQEMCRRLLAAIGFDKDQLMNTMFYQVMIALPVEIEGIKTHIAALPEFPEMVAAVETAYDAIINLNDDYNADYSELYAQYTELRRRLEDAIAARDEQQLVVDGHLLEIAQIEGGSGVYASQLSVLQNTRNNLNQKLDVINGILNNTPVVIGGLEYRFQVDPTTGEAVITIYTELPDGSWGAQEVTLDELKQALIDDIELRINGSENNVQGSLVYQLTYMQQQLQRVENGEIDQLLQYNIELAEMQLEQAETNYNTLLERFNLYNQLLSDYIASLTGNTEETPEA